MLAIQGDLPGNGLRRRGRGNQANGDFYNDEMLSMEAGRINSICSKQSILVIIFSAFFRAAR